MAVDWVCENYGHILKVEARKFVDRLLTAVFVFLKKGTS